MYVCMYVHMHMYVHMYVHMLTCADPVCLYLCRFVLVAIACQICLALLISYVPPLNTVFGTQVCVLTLIFPFVELQ